MIWTLTLGCILGLLSGFLVGLTLNYQMQMRERARMRRRLATLELAQCVARRALLPDAPMKSVQYAINMFEGRIDPTSSLDAALDLAWVEGRTGGRHPLHDSSNAFSLSIALEAERLHPWRPAHGGR